MIKTAWDILGYAHDAMNIVDEYVKKKNTERAATFRREEAEREEISKRSKEWINWRNSLPAAKPAMDAVSVLAYAESAKHSPIISNLISKVQDLPKPVKLDVITLMGDHSKFESDSDKVCAHLVELWNKYNMWNLPPEVQLANVISYRNALERSGASESIIGSFDIEIGRLAHAYSISRFTG